MLIGGFKLLRGCLIYTCADTDAYILTLISPETAEALNQ